MKQMLLSQWLTETSPFAASSTNGTTGESGGMFELLLGQLMETASIGGTTASGSSLPSNANMLASWGTTQFGNYLTSDTGSSSAFDGLISAAAAKYGVDPALIKGIVQTESSFQSNAVSSAGAKGLMQLMDGTARGLGVTDSLDPAQNVEGGTRFLSYLLRKYEGNVTSALAAYNAGPGRVDRLGLTTDALLASRMSELPEETQQYIGKVLEASRQWSASF
ncbi:lytic transglycosylase domain-containing protein [Cohnella faecalis]|uniref:Lytic transglycosylase domain-containing protein n=2 Tax=Cohnella faecalis TaxID=2315694 RepID=A0A398CT98_9BACL|nr:lytic transglycosylase domain-containing protein [Cohnella faecalis]